MTSARVRWILAEDEPQIIGYDQDLWVDGLHHDRDDPEALIGLFDALRTANLALLSTRPAADLERFGRHNERGPESYGLMIRLTAGHDRFHVAQAERALAAVRGAPQAAVEPSIAVRQPAEVVDELGGLGHGEVRAEHAEVDGQHLEAVGAGVEDARPLVDRLDGPDPGPIRSAIVAAGAWTVTRAWYRQRRPATPRDTSAATSSSGAARGVNRGAEGQPRHDPVDPERPPVLAVRVPRHEVPAPAPVDEPVRLRPRAGWLSRRGPR